ncbi:hypothetical protein TNCV_119501 [Trichonephila clavipes]|nr:hypothetical protein TNCV_119501 [Trichonephila clavipes]
MLKSTTGYSEEAVERKIVDKDTIRAVRTSRNIIRSGFVFVHLDFVECSFRRYVHHCNRCYQVLCTVVYVR